VSVERVHGDNDQLSASKRFSPRASAPLYDPGIRGILGKYNDEGEAFYTFLPGIDEGKFSTNIQALTLRRISNRDDTLCTAVVMGSNNVKIFAHSRSGASPKTSGMRTSLT
jgi:hypothetical protein